MKSSKKTTKKKNGKTSNKRKKKNNEHAQIVLEGRVLIETVKNDIVTSSEEIDSSVVLKCILHILESELKETMQHRDELEEIESTIDEKFKKASI